MDAEKRARRASELVTYHQEAGAEFSRLRREALAELVAEDWTHKNLARLLGMTRPDRPTAVVRAAARTDTARGRNADHHHRGKPEGPKPTTASSTMISEESSRAYDLIAETAASYG